MLFLTKPPCLAEYVCSQGHTLVAMDHFIIDYSVQDGLWRAMHCPPLSIREGIPNPSCRKLGFGRWPARHELTYLGLGRVMLW